MIDRDLIYPHDRFTVHRGLARGRPAEFDGAELLALIDRLADADRDAADVRALVQADNWPIGTEDGSRLATLAELTALLVNHTQKMRAQRDAAIAERDELRAIMHELECQAEEGPPPGQHCVEVINDGGTFAFTRLDDELETARAAAAKVREAAAALLPSETKR